MLRGPLLSIFIALTRADQLYYRFSDEIATQDYHYACTMAQGDHVTLLQCPATHEIYNTQQLAEGPYSLVNSGAASPIRCARNSHETNKGGHITYVEKGKQIWETYRDPEARITPTDDGIVKRVLMTLDLEDSEFVREVWVFDAIVPVWLSTD